MRFTDLTAEYATKFIDHVNASHNLWRSGIKVVSLEEKNYSITVKHPSSITAFNNIVQGNFDKNAVTAKMSAYIEEFSSVEFPAELGWMREIFSKVVSIYKKIV